MELMKGTLDVLVLKALSSGPGHGYGVIEWIKRHTKGALEVEDAALYQALHRMERRDWLESQWGRSQNNRRAKYYQLTDKGQRELDKQTVELRRYMDALFGALRDEVS